MSEGPFVPQGFVVPDGLTAGEFRLAPLGPQHNEADYAALMSSIDHIRATPGFGEGNWPREMSLDDNLRTCSGTPGISLSAAGSPTPCSAPAPAMSSAAFTSTRPTARDQVTVSAACARPSNPGCAPTTPRSTRPSTTRSSRGWNATGRLIRSSTLREPDLCRPVRAHPRRRCAGPGPGTSGNPDLPRQPCCRYRA